MKTNNHLVIMAGGVGSRFWPMSTQEQPKQFIDVLGVGKTLLQLTAERFGTLIDRRNIWVVTNQKYVDIVRQQLPDIPEGNILCEPCRRNTAPCIAYVSWRIRKQDPKANIVVTPSDHVVMNVQEFQRVIQSCMAFTADAQQVDLSRRLIPREARPRHGPRIYQEEQLLLECRHLHLERSHHHQCLPHLPAEDQQSL